MYLQSAEAYFSTLSSRITTPGPKEQTAFTCPTGHYPHRCMTIRVRVALWNSIWRPASKKCLIDRDKLRKWSRTILQNARAREEKKKIARNRLKSGPLNLNRRSGNDLRGAGVAARDACPQVPSGRRSRSRRDTPEHASEEFSARDSYFWRQQLPEE